MPGTPEPSETSSSGAKRSRWRPWLIGLGLLFAAIVAEAIFTREPGVADQLRGQDEVACESAVRDRLKAPSTASFGDWSFRSLGGADWTLSGWVDAENAFGARIRSDVVCRFQKRGAGPPAVKVTLLSR